MGLPLPTAMDLDRVLRSTDVAAFATDAACRIVACNESAASVFDLTPQAMTSRPCYELLDGHDLAGTRYCARACAARRAAAAGRPIAPFALRVRCGARGPALAEVVSIVLPGDHGDSRVLLHLLRFDHTDLKTDPAGGPRSRADRLLTPRETEVLARIASGSSVKQVAYELSTSLTTARAHVRNILRKLCVHRQIDAVLAGQRRGLL